MAIIQISKIQVRSGNLTDIPQLDGGELGFAQDQRRLFIGNDDTRPGDPQPPVPNNTEILTQYSPIDGTQLRGNITAAGSNTQVQFNDQGILTGSDGLTIQADTANSRSAITVSNSNVVVETNSNLEIGVNHLYITPETGSNVLGGYSLILANAANGMVEWAPITGNGLPGGVTADLQYKVDTTTFGGAPGFVFSGAGNLANAANLPNTLTVAANNYVFINGTLTANGNVAFNNTVSLSGNVDFSGNVDLANTSNLLLGNTAHIQLTGGSNGQYLQTDGAGNISWSTVSLSNINAGNSNVTVEANGNVGVSVAGNSNIAVFSTAGIGTSANISANNLVITGNIGNAQAVQFDITGNITSNSEGLLYWSETDQTLNINHESGVVQQVGQEQYVLTLNTTGSNITNGTVVGFSGADANTNRITISPYQANGTQPTVNLIGVATQDIANATVGFVTTFGVVRGLNASGNTVSETWNVGDILYANPNTAGVLTKTKPTAPNNVIPVAAVLSNNATTGEIFVRPTIEQQLSYGRFVAATGANITANAVNTPQTVQFNITDIASGISLVDSNANIQVTNSGYYQLNVNLQVATSDNSPSTCYAWIRQDGNNVPYSMHRVAVDASASPVASMTIVWGISLAANSKVQIAWATSSTDTVLQSSGNTAFGPSTAAVVVDIIQAQL